MNASTLVLALWLSASSPSSDSAVPATPVLHLEEAIRTAVERQPQLHQAQAIENAVSARVREARAAFLPQVNLNAAYQKTTSNFSPRPGSVPSTFTQASPASFRFRDFYSASLTANQLIYDGQTFGQYDAAKASADAQRASTLGTRRLVVLNVQTAYFNARADKDLVSVAQDTLGNQNRHLNQIQGFVEVGTRSQIDLAQARTDRSNAQLQLINAQNTYLLAKAQLNQAMGVEGSLDYELGNETVRPLPKETSSVDELMPEAAQSRPELAAAESQVRVQEALIRAARGGYFPAISATASATEAGPQLSAMTWNVSGQIGLSWGLFQGLLTQSQVEEAYANVAAATAQRDVLRQQIRLELEQAVVGLRGAQGALVAASEVLTNAKEQFRLAEGRYQTGVGSIIELGDAQISLTNASAQEVRARFNVFIARAQLAASLGRPPETL